MFIHRTHLAFAAFLTLTTSCGTAVVEPGPPEGAALFQTDSATYTFVTTAVATQGRIGTTLINRSGRAMYFVNCNGRTSLSIQRLEAAQWTHFWSPVQLLCLSPPIMVQNGGTQTFDIRDFAGNAGSNVFPKFERPLVTGVYRVIWNDAYFNYRDRQNGVPWSDPVPVALRVSNSFVIRAP